MTAHPHLRRGLAAAAVLPLALFLAACGSDDDGDEPDAAPTVTVTDSPSTSTGTPEAEGRVGPTGGLVAAAATAEQAVEGATVTSIDEDPQGWEVSLVGGSGGEQEVVVSADGSRVVTGPRPDDDVDPGDASEEEALVDAAQIDYAAAVEAATGAASGDAVGADLDDDAGRTVWTVDVRDGTTEQEVTVDAATGDVIGTETDD